MAVFTALMTTMFEMLVGDQWGLGGRTARLQVATARLVGADKHQAQTYTLSAGLSAVPIMLAPLGISAPALLTFLTSDLPIDVRTNAATDAVCLSGVQLLVFTGHLAAIFVTTGSAITTLSHEIAGGSNATLTTTLPLA